MNQNKKKSSLDEFRYIWKLAPHSFIVMIVLGILNIFVSLLTVHAAEKLMLAITDAAGRKLYFAVCIYALLIICSSLYSVWYTRYYVQFHAIVKFEKKLRSELHAKNASLSNEQFEAADINSLLRMADGARQNLFRYEEIVIRTCMAVMQFSAVGAYAASFRIEFLFLMPMAVIPAFINLVYEAKLWGKYYRESEQCKREEEAYAKAMTDEVACKESRLTRAGELLQNKWSTSRSHRSYVEDLKSRKVFLLKILMLPLQTVGNAGGYILSAVLLFCGRINYAEFAAAIAAYTAMTGAFKSLVSMVGNEKLYHKMTQPFFRFMNLPERGGIPYSEPLSTDIRLEHVYFKYPGADQYALEDVCLKLKEGDVLAIVGENGAGKTTLANIILGLYQPTVGAVYYGNIRVDNMVREQDLHRQQSVVPQNFCRYKMTAGENISIGDIERNDSERTEKLFSRFLGKRDLNSDTLLGKEFGGKELSGGEWQRLACARGFYKNSNLLALDEPTSAIDPLNEKDIYDSFREELNGKTGLIITHRLGAIGLADRIVVLKKGRIEAQGFHEQLLENCPLYSELWKTQAGKYEAAIYQ